MRVEHGWMVIIALVLTGCADDAPPTSSARGSLEAMELVESCELRADAGMWQKRSWGKCVEGLLADEGGRGIGMEAQTVRTGGEDGIMGTEDDLFVTTILARASTETETIPDC